MEVTANEPIGYLGSDRICGVHVHRDSRMAVKRAANWVLRVGAMVHLVVSNRMRIGAQIGRLTL